MSHHNDTIVAIATAQGPGAIAVIRLSGENAIGICDKVFQGKTLTDQPSHTIHYGFIHDGKLIDEVMVSLFRSPKSYTTEDVVEIACHGSPYIQQQILQALVKQGARLANPGEFTLRAFLNGRIDLSQAEAVADLIASSTKNTHKIALDQMRGGFRNELIDLRQKLLHFASLIELELDFSEEDVEFANRHELVELLHAIQSHLQQLIQSFSLGNVIKHGVPVAIVGKPNAGKSTLLNALVNEERAIVSDIPGTTRDTIEETIQIDGILFRFIDTAGLRNTEDQIESIGVQKALEKIKKASVGLYVFDISDSSPQKVRAEIQQLDIDIPYLLVGNKADIASDALIEAHKNTFDNLVVISAIEKHHLKSLTQRLYQKAIGSHSSDEHTIITNERHLEALNKSLQAIQEVLEALTNQLSTDLIALDIRRALDSLGEITGEVTTDEILGTIFSKFCIGK